jgi:hypothetical protein
MVYNCAWTKSDMSAVVVKVDSNSKFGFIEHSVDAGKGQDHSLQALPHKLVSYKDVCFIMRFNTKS